MALGRCASLKRTKKTLVTAAAGGLFDMVQLKGNPRHGSDRAVQRSSKPISVSAVCRFQGPLSSSNWNAAAEARDFCVGGGEQCCDAVVGE
ncbi:hypothetical protein SRHO_G00133660 [Serrasalmus rhombeus]